MNRKLIIIGMLLILAILVYSCNSKTKINNEMLASASRGDYGRIKELLADGADVNYTKKGDPATALYKAAYKGHTRVVELLIDHDADVNVSDQNGTTPLMNAAFGHTDTVWLLLKYGADVNARDDSGVTALIRATYKNQVEIVKMLIRKGADVNLKDDSGDTALILAERRGYSDIAGLLRGAGAQ